MIISLILYILGVWLMWATVLAAEELGYKRAKTPDIFLICAVWPLVSFMSIIWAVLGPSKKNAS